MNRFLFKLTVSVLLVVYFANWSYGMPEQEFPFGRIVNGEATTIEAHPYQVSLQLLMGSHFCGGSLISSDTILTAAHCLETRGYVASDLQVRLGSTLRGEGGEVVSVRAAKYHELYNSTSMENDVAILKLSSPVRQTGRIRIIELADAVPENGTPAVVTGWGTTCFLICSSSQSLLEVTVDTLHWKDCASDSYRYGSRIMESMLCAYAASKDACQGDSGGPLVANGKQVGVVSWGQGCAWSGYPGVYADVAALRSWIDHEVATL